MPQEVLQKVGTQIIFADHATDWAGGAVGTSLEVTSPTETQVQILMEGLTAGQGRQSDKADLGVTRAAQFSVMMAMEFATAPTTGQVFNLYWAPSNQSTAAHGNPMEINGADNDAPTGGAPVTLLELTDACLFIGSAVCSADATGNVQVMYVGMFSSPTRWGCLIAVNDTTVVLHSDSVEMHVVFDPIVDEVQ